MLLKYATLYVAPFLLYFHPKTVKYLAVKKGSSINDVAQFWTFFEPPPQTSRFSTVVANIWNPSPLRECRHLWTTPSRVFRSILLGLSLYANFFYPKTDFDCVRNCKYSETRLNELGYN